MKHGLQLAILLLLFTHHLMAQVPCHPTALRQFETDGVRARFHNDGNLGWDIAGNPRYEVPKGGPSALYTGTLWLGGYDQTGILHLAAATYRQLGNDYYAGPFRTTGQHADCANGFEVPSTNAWSGPHAHSSGFIYAVNTSGLMRYTAGSGVSTHPFSTAILGPSAIELSNGKILVLEGSSGTPTSPSALVDPMTLQVTQTVTPLYNHYRSHLVNLANGELLIYGSGGVERFNPTTTTFSPAAPMAVANAYGSGVLLADGRVLVAGGGTTTATDQTQFYTPATNTWAIGPAMTFSRNLPTLIRLPSGKVLIAGGASTGQMEEFDPQSNTIAPVYAWGVDATLNDGELLQNGQVLFSVTDSGSTYLHEYNPVTQSNRRYNTYAGERLVQTAAGEVYFDWFEDEFQQLNTVAGRPNDQPWQWLWGLSRNEIDQFRQDFLNQSVNFANYPDIETWPGNGNTALGEDHHLAPFVDVNQDGWYRSAQDGDYPCILGDQALWWVYNDAGPHTESRSMLALNVQVETMAYAFDCDLTPCPDSNLRYAVFQHSEITNHSIHDYTNFRISTFADADLGNGFDDFVGSDTLLQMAFTYNGDPIDETAYGYGANPPAFGVMMLENEHIPHATNFMYFNNSIDDPTGIPQAAFQYYDLMRSHWRDGAPVVNNGLDGHPNSGPGPVTNWMLSGDPGLCGQTPSGWSEFSAQNTPADRRMLLSAGPFQLDRDSTIAMDQVYLFAQGSTHLSSVCSLKTLATNLIAWWPSMDKSCMAQATGKPDPVTIPAMNFALAPNPTTQGTQIVLSEPAHRGCRYVLHDLTGRTLQEGGIQAGTTIQTLDLRTIPAGLYTVIVWGNGLRPSTQRLMIAH